MYTNLSVMHHFVPYTQAKTLRGRKDTLAPVFFYWGAIAPAPGSTPLIGGKTDTQTQTYRDEQSTH